MNQIGVVFQKKKKKKHSKKIGKKTENAQCNIKKLNEGRNQEVRVTVPCCILNLCHPEQVTGFIFTSFLL